MTTQNGHAPVPLDTARALLRDGIHAIPVKHRAKTVQRDGWIRERWEEPDLDSKFGGVTNIGILLGDASAKLADCDLDTKEAVVAAARFLPPTGMVWGRESKQRSHYGYVLDHTGPKNLSFKDPTLKKTDADAEHRMMLCELRIRGQTIGPGSVHPSGELIDWSDHDTTHSPSPVVYDALKAALGRVAACALLARYWAEGIRHDACLALSGMLCRGGMDENQSNHFVESLCIAAGESLEEMANRLATVSDTYRRAERGESFSGAATLEEYFDPRIVTRVREWLDLTRSAYTGDIGPDGWPLSDIGNAERFSEKWRGQMLYCADESSWYVWTGRHWERDRKGVAYRRAIDVVNAFRTLAHTPTTVSRGNTTPDQWKRHAEKLGQLRQIRSMLELAGAMLPVVPEEFDADPLILNVQNGTLELNVTSGEVYLRDWRSDDMLSMVCAVPYIAGATHPLFSESLDLFFPEPERRSFFQEHAGYSTTGLPKRYALQLIGPTNSGKSFMLDLIGRVLGDYAGTLKYESLMRSGKGGDVPRSDMWNIQNKRLITVSEIPSDTTYDVALFKSLLSGGDKTRVRNMYDRSGGRDITYVFSLWTSGNAPYGPPGSEEAAYERLHVLRCDHQVPRAQRSDLKQAQTLDMATTGSAVLAWMLEGFTRLYSEKRGHLDPPDFVVDATRAIQDDKDPWSDFFDPSHVTITNDPEDGVLKAELWAIAREWRERETGRLTGVRKAQWDFEASVARRVGQSRQSTSRWNNRDYWPGLLWSQALLDARVVTPPDWSSYSSNGVQ